MFQDEKPPNTRDLKYRGQYTHHGHNPNFKQGVPPGKFQELAEFLIKERVMRQKYQAMYNRMVEEMLELRNQLATRWESNDEERARMELDYEAFVASDRVGDEPDEGVAPSHVTPVMSAESSLEGTHESVDQDVPGVCDVVLRGHHNVVEVEEVEVVEVAAPAPSKKRKAPPPGVFLGSGGSSQDRVRVDSRDSMGKSMEY